MLLHHLGSSKSSVSKLDEQLTPTPRAEPSERKASTNTLGSGCDDVFFDALEGLTDDGTLHRMTSEFACESYGV